MPLEEFGEHAKHRMKCLHVKHLQRPSKTKVSSVLLDVQVPQLDHIGGGTHFLKSAQIRPYPKPQALGPKP